MAAPDAGWQPAPSGVVGSLTTASFAAHEASDRVLVSLGAFAFQDGKKQLLGPRAYCVNLHDGAVQLLSEHESAVSVHWVSDVDVLGLVAHVQYSALVWWNCTPSGVREVHRIKFTKKDQPFAMACGVVAGQPVALLAMPKRAVFIAPLGDALSSLSHIERAFSEVAWQGEQFVVRLTRYGPWVALDPSELPAPSSLIPAPKATAKASSKPAKATVAEWRVVPVPGLPTLESVPAAIPAEELHALCDALHIQRSPLRDPIVRRNHDVTVALHPTAPQVHVRVGDQVFERALPWRGEALFVDAAFQRAFIVGGAPTWNLQPNELVELDVTRGVIAPFLPSGSFSTAFDLRWITQDRVLLHERTNMENSGVLLCERSEGQWRVQGRLTLKKTDSPSFSRDGMRVFILKGATLEGHRVSDVGFEREAKADVPKPARGQCALVHETQEGLFYALHLRNKFRHGLTLSAAYRVEMP